MEEISEEIRKEIFSTLETLRITSITTRYVFTPLMDEVLQRARAGRLVVSFNRLVEFWQERGWPPLTKTTLRDRHIVLQKRKQLKEYP